MSILDEYVMKLPDAQNAIDLFKGEWSSTLPADVKSGPHPLFDDGRITALGEAIGGFKDKTILELGPLEAAHTHMMLNAGAASVVAIEANSRAYVKCLIVKELLEMQGAQFLLGDFDKHLEEKPGQYDFILACGVLYHTVNPVATIVRMAEQADRIGIWSHFFEEKRVREIYGRNFRYSPEIGRHGDVEAELYTHTYKRPSSMLGFCGGGTSKVKWMTRQGFIDVFDALGFDLQILSEGTAHPNGPEMTALAVRRGTT